MQKIILFIAGLFLAACTTGSGSHVSTLMALDIENSGQLPGDRDMLLPAFINLCPARINSADEFSALASKQGWFVVDDRTLAKAGLSKLRKLVLEIPGGGSPVRETQILYSRQHGDEELILAIEERFEHQQLLYTACSMYGQTGSLLKTCAALGKAIGRAPDQNRRYDKSNAHFIAWHDTIKGKSTRMRCQQSPNSMVLPYSGVTLSLYIGQNTSRSGRIIKPGKPVNSKSTVR